MHIVLNMLVFGQLAHFFHGGVQLAIDDLSLSLSLEGLKHEVLPPGPEETTISTCVAKLLQPTSLPTLAKQSVKLFGNSQKQTAWPCEALLNLAKELVSIVPEELVSVEMTQFRVVGSEPWSSADSVWRAAEVWMAMSQTAMAMAFLTSRCAYDNDIVRDGQIKEEIETAFNFARNKANLAADLLSKLPRDLVSKLSDHVWALPLGVAQTWVEVAQASIVCISELFICRITQSITAVASSPSLIPH